MQPAVSDAWVAEAGDPWIGLAALVAGAVVASVLTGRIGAASIGQRWQRWLHIASVCAWAIALGLGGLRLLSTPTPTLAETGARALLASAAVLIALPVLRDLFAGLALMIEGRVGLGDEIEVDGVSGQVARCGLRSLTLRGSEGQATLIPYRRLAAGPLLRHDPRSRDAGCEFEVAIPPGVELEALSQRLLEAALLSPYAAPGRRPEVFVVADPSGAPRVRVRAVVFDRAYADRYRGDVLVRAGLDLRRATIPCACSWQPRGC